MNSNTALAEHARYECFSASVDITPERPIPLAGYSSRTGVSVSLHSRLEANAVFIANSQGGVLFLSADLLYFGGELAAALSRHAEKYGIDQAHVILSASHTHYGPVTDQSKPKLGNYDANYNAFLMARLKQLIDLVASSRPKRVIVQVGRARTDLNINRRRRWHLPTLTRDGVTLPPSIVMAHAREGVRDEFVDVLSFVNEDGQIEFVAWKFACHPVGFPFSHHISSEFPGEARRKLRRHLGRDIPVVFWQGFAGDVCPKLPSTPSFGERIHMLRGGPGLPKADFPGWSRWSEHVADTLLEIIRDGALSTLSGAIEAHSVDIPLEALFDGTANAGIAQRKMKIQTVSFGRDFSVVFIGAEVCSPYLALLRAGPRKICVGYTGDVFGYLPSDIQIREGGYESGGYLPKMGFSGSLKIGFEQEVLGAERSLGPQAD